MGPGCGPRCFPEGDFLWVVYSLRRGCPAISRAEKSIWSLDGAIELAIDTILISYFQSYALCPLVVGWLPCADTMTSSIHGYTEPFAGG